MQEETDVADLLRRVERGELDLTFADLPLPPGPFESAEVLQDPYVLLVSSKSELAARETGAAAARPRRRAADRVAQQQRARALPTGHVPGLDFVFRTDDNGTLVGLVAEGLGAAVVPRLVVNPRNPAVVALPLGSRVPPRVLAIVWHRDRYRSAASQAFADLARELGADYAARISEPSSAAAASTSRRPGR